MRGKEFTPMACPVCGCEVYTVRSLKQYESSVYIQAVSCANDTCRHTIGLLEPNSVISKLSIIDITLKRVSNLLDKIEPQLGIQAPDPKIPAKDPVAVPDHKNIYPQIPQTMKYNRGIPQDDNPQDHPMSANQSQQPGEKISPGEDPESSDPEADQSPV